MKIAVYLGALVLPLLAPTTTPGAAVSTSLVVEYSTDDGLTWSAANPGDEAIGKILIGAVSVDGDEGPPAADYVGIVVDDGGTDTLYRVDAWSLGSADRDFFYDNYGDDNDYTMTWDGASLFVSIQ